VRCRPWLYCRRDQQARGVQGRVVIRALVAELRRVELETGHSWASKPPCREAADRILLQRMGRLCAYAGAATRVPVRNCCSVRSAVQAFLQSGTISSPQDLPRWLQPLRVDVHGMPPTRSRTDRARPAGRGRSASPVGSTPGRKPAVPGSAAACGRRAAAFTGAARSRRPCPLARPGGRPLLRGIHLQAALDLAGRNATRVDRRHVLWGDELRLRSTSGWTRRVEPGQLSIALVASSFVLPEDPLITP